MNHDGPWSWRSTRQGKRVQSDEQRAYAERVTANKKKASARARRQRKAAEAAEIRARNARPIS